MRVDVTANNIANMSTTGYNARRAEFVDLHYQQIRTPGAITALSGEVLPAGIQLGLGVRPSAVSMEVRQGAVRRTGGELDVAIEGAGYFEITLPSGEAAYTRDGAFKLTGDGELVTSDGFPVVPAITVPADAREVVMIFRERGLGIRTEGRALESGGAGEVVRVLNLTSRRSVLATVTGENRVEVSR